VALHHLGVAAKAGGGQNQRVAADFLDRFAAVAGTKGRGAGLVVRSVPIEEADRRARQGGFAGMLSDELDCMLCDEVADPSPLATLLGRPLLDLDDALAVAIAGTGRV